MTITINAAIREEAKRFLLYLEEIRSHMSKQINIDKDFDFIYDAFIGEFEAEAVALVLSE